MEQHYITSFDITNLPRFAIGFDRMFEELARTQEKLSNTNYPPYNILRTAETEYSIEVAVAGFEEDELEVELVDGELIIKGETKSKTVENIGNYLHRGIAARNFVRTFALPDDVEIKGARVRNGILTVDVEIFIPQSTKKTIAITFEK